MSFEPQTLVGSSVGEYELTAFGGRFGSVLRYTARHQQLRRSATCHVLEPSASAAQKERFLQVARQVSKLRHRSLLDIFDSGQTAQSPYFISEEIVGETLLEWIERHQYTLRTLRLFVEQLSQMVGVLQAADVVLGRLLPDSFVVRKSGGVHRMKLVGLHDENPSESSRPTTDKTLLWATAQCVFGLCQSKPFSVRLPETISLEKPLLEARHRLAGVSDDVDELLRRALADPSFPASPIEFLETLTEALAKHLPLPSRWERVRRFRLPLLAVGVVALLSVTGSVVRRFVLSKKSSVEKKQAADANQSVAELHASAKKTLEMGLRSTEPTVREQALRALLHSSDVGWRGHVEPLLDDSALPVQIRAAEVLGSLGSRRALTALQTHLREEYPVQLRLAVAQAMRKLGEPLSRKALGSLATSDQLPIKRGVAQLLAEQGDAEADKFLAELQNQEGEEALAARLWAARRSDEDAMSKLSGGLPKTPPLLLRDVPVAELLLKQEQPEMRELLEQTAKQPGPAQLLSAQVLCTHDDPSFRGLFRDVLRDQKTSLADKLEAAFGLLRCSDRSDTKLLLECLLEGIAPEPLRQVCAGALLRQTSLDPEQLSEQGVAWAKQALEDDNWTVRQSAVALLGESAPTKTPTATGQSNRAEKEAQATVKQILDLLQSALADSSLPVRLTAIRSSLNVAKNTHDLQATERLKSLLRKRADEGLSEEKTVAAAALLRLGDASRRNTLHQGLRSPDVAVRRVAILEASADSKLPTNLLWALTKDRDLLVRFQAAVLLLQHGEKSPALLKILREALQHGGGIGVQAYDWLGKKGALPPQVENKAPDLNTLLASSDVLERLQAINRLASLSAEDAGALLLKATRDPDATVRFRLVDVVESHCEQGGASLRVAWPAVRVLAEDSDVAVRARAIAVLVRFQASVPLPSTEKRPATGQTTRKGPGDEAADTVPTPTLSQEAAKANLAVEQQFATGNTLYKAGNFRAAQKALEKTSQLCANKRLSLPKCDQVNSNLAYQLGATYEKLGLLANAMSEYQKILQSKTTGKRPPVRALYDAAHQGVERLHRKLGRLILYKNISKRCQKVEVFMPPGKHQVSVGGGQRKAVELDAGETVELRTCK